MSNNFHKFIQEILLALLIGVFSFGVREISIIGDDLRSLNEKMAKVITKLAVHEVQISDIIKKIDK